MTADRIDELLRLASQRALSLARLPGSTYRIQFHAGFTFQNATAIVPYLADLGITHLYASPYLAAVAGSMHGYDVIDHDRLNPELGTEADYEELLRVLKRYGLSHILDTVPNHVGVDTNDNAWWNSVLEHGRASPFARYFDISWRGSASADLHDRVLIPILGDSYGKVLEGGQLKVEYEGDTDRLVVVYFNRRFPISPSTRELVFGKSAADSRDMGHAITELNGSPGDPRTFDRLDALLQAQHYRLAWWRAAPDEINYRRFFDINGLAALAMERAEVFIAAHAFTLRLAAQAKITGLRVDHPDGLYDPKKYFRRLQQHYLVAIAEEIARESPDWRDDVWKEVEPELIARLSAREKDAEEATAPLLYVVAEKILAADEGLPSDWSCHGTSGYDFLVMVNELFVDQANEAAFSRLYESISRQTDGFGELAYRNKLFVLNQSFAGDLHRLTRRLQRLAANDRRARDFSFRNLQDALRELIACFPVYRTYIDSDCVSGQDQSYLESAAKDAIDRNPKMQAEVFHFVRDMLLQLPADSFTFPDRARQLRLAGKFQQLTSPVMAKGVEDTAFYQYQRLIALNEVGGDPGRFGIDPAELHRYLSHRQQSWPFALNALSTHDTKRSEDVRARINVLSEMPVEWEARVRRWMTLNASQRDNIGGIPAPAPDEEYLLYQTLVGIWPLSGAAGVDDTFIRRVLQFMQKALREAKLRTSWTEPAPQWEAAVENFVRRILDKSSAGEFLADVSSFVQTVSHYGLINSLSQTLLRLAAPGVPDTYQGSELWDFSLVDPDNRRPVNFEFRRQLLAELRAVDASATGERDAKVRELLDQKEDGRVKLWLTSLVLRCRRKYPELFSAGEYLPIEATGAMPRHVFAFARRHRETCLLCVVPRLVAGLAPAGARLPLGDAVWADTRFALPDGFEHHPLHNMITGEQVSSGTQEGGNSLLLSQVLADFPVALLLSETTDTF